MNKREFLEQLRKDLSCLPREETGERLNFYNEMIDDLVEEGLTEEEAVLKIGAPGNIAEQIIAEVPLTKLIKEKVTPAKKKFKAWEITLLVLGSPLWLSLLIAAFAVLIALYAVIWSVVICLWAAFASVVGGGIGGVCGGIGVIIGGNAFSGIALIGAGLVCFGIAILLFYGCKAVTKGTVMLTKKCIFGIKNRIIKKEEA